MTRSLHVTDHALIRYMERVLKLEMDNIRAEISTRVANAAIIGAEIVTVEGVTYKLGVRENRAAVITCFLDLPENRPPPSKQPPPDKRRSDWEHTRIHQYKRRRKKR